MDKQQQFDSCLMSKVSAAYCQKFCHFYVNRICVTIFKKVDEIIIFQIVLTKAKTLNEFFKVIIKYMFQILMEKLFCSLSPSVVVILGPQL